MRNYSEYNIQINVRFIRPVLMRGRHFSTRHRTTTTFYDPMDMGRQAQFMGLPWHDALVQLAHRLRCCRRSLHE